MMNANNAVLDRVIKMVPKNRIVTIPISVLPHHCRSVNAIPKERGAINAT